MRSEKVEAGIHRIQQAIDYDKEHRIVTKFDKTPLDRDLYEAVLNYISELEQENKKLEDVRKWYFENAVGKAVSPEMLHKILRQDYVSKDKIRDKIEEISNKILETNEHSYSYEVIEYTAQVEVLQELLEESGKNG